LACLALRTLLRVLAPLLRVLSLLALLRVLNRLALLLILGLLTLLRILIGLSNLLDRL